MAQSVAAGRDHRVAEARGGNLFAFAWRQSRRHQPWLCLLAVLIVPLTMVPLELQRRIIDRAIGLQNFDLLLWLGAIYLVVALLQGGLKYLLRLYSSTVGERTVLNLRRAVQSRHACGVEGETVSIVASEVERVGGFVGEAFSEPILQGGILAVVLGYMLVVEPTIALVGLAFFAADSARADHPAVRQPACSTQDQARA
jgi:ABC-type bacteriocin/lantibiotic exporter with double-glycine peptidase domain